MQRITHSNKPIIKCLEWQLVRNQSAQDLRHGIDVVQLN
ncbi:uncharacterized protein METZ01_LOCUS128326 [marine metagenome]|uniref:Uncharacterized protein n=1 Tax=marine metagenome TaxID=408172 RepID=A0A381YFU8_9ZZZZ